MCKAATFYRVDSPWSLKGAGKKSGLRNGTNLHRKELIVWPQATTDDEFSFAVRRSSACFPGAPTSNIKYKKKKSYPAFRYFPASRLSCQSSRKENRDARPPEDIPEKFNILFLMKRDESQTETET